MRRTIDFKFIACVLGGCLLLGVGVYFLHGFQVSRTAGVLLRRAEAAEAEKDYRKAADYLNHYVGHHPEDVDAWARRAEALDEQWKKTKSPREAQAAYFALGAVLLKDPQRSTVRRRLVDLALLFREYEEANRNLKELKKNSPDDGEIELLMGKCEIGLEKDLKAADHLEAAIRLAPSNLESYERLAALYQMKLHQADDANRIVNRMVEQNDKSARAHLSRAQYFLQFHDKDENEAKRKAREKTIEEDLHVAAKLDPKDADVLLLGAEFAKTRENWDEAHELLGQGLKANPKNKDFYLATAALELTQLKSPSPEEFNRSLSGAIKVLQQGLKELPEDERLLEALANLSLRSGDATQAKSALDRMGKAKSSGTAKEYLEAGVFIQQGKWGEAARLLEGLRARAGKSAALDQDVELLLGQCHERLGNPDQALFAFEQAIKLNPTSAAARRGLGTALLNLGRVEEAVANYKQILKLNEKKPEDRLSLARALVAREMQLPANKRKWDGVDGELAQAAKDLPDRPEFIVLQATVKLLKEPENRTRAQEVVADLEKATQKHPDQVELWVALADAAGRGSPQGALDVLAKAEKQPKLEDRVELRLAKLRYISILPKEKSPEQQLAQLEAEAKKAKKEDRLRLLGALAGAYSRAGAAQEAERIWKQLAQEQPENLGVQLVLFDLAMRGGKEADLEDALKQIRRVEGGVGGPLWHFGEASRMFQQVRQKDQPPAARTLSDIRRHLAEVSKKRPNWSRVPAFLAEVNLVEGKKDQALDDFRRAVRLGDRRPVVLRQFVKLLYETKQLSEIDQVVGKLAEQEDTVLSAGLGKLAAVLTADPKRTPRLAVKSVPADSKDYRDFLWLGQVLAKSGPEWEEKAGQAFEQARKLKPEVPETWVILFNFLQNKHLKDNDQKEAQAVLARAQKELPSADAATVLGFADQLRAEREQDKEKAKEYNSKAEERFLAAVDARPADPQLLRNLATFYLREGSLAKAETYLQRILKLSGDSAAEQKAWARRGLALVLASQNNYQQFQKALLTLDENKRSPGETAEDVRVRAVVLAKRPERREEAIRHLKSLGDKQLLTEADKWLLVQLYDADKNWKEAQPLLLNLLDASEGKNADYLAFYADRLLRKNQTAQAERWLEKLRSEEPASLRTTELGARILAAQRDPVGAVKLLRDYAAAEGKKQELGWVALLVEALGEGSANKQFFLDEAEKMFQENRSRKPENHLEYASFLGRRYKDKGYKLAVREEKAREALNECKEAWERGVSGPTGYIAVAVLRALFPNPEDFLRPDANAHYRRVEGWLKAGAEKAKNPADFLFLLADLNDLHGDYRQAIAFNRQALQLSPNNVVALNNLAWYLAVYEGKGEAALEKIEQALDILGPLPSLLDTKGAVLLSLKRGDLAVPFLKQVLAERPSGAGYFRLARAYASKGQEAASDAAFSEVERLSLTAESLHPLERDEYNRMRNEYYQKRKVSAK